jgi:hypothetical protein
MIYSKELIKNIKSTFGVMGAVCLLAIIPIKLLRFSNLPTVISAIGIAPSILGPAGLLFLLRSGTNKLSRLSLLQTAVLVGTVAVSLELLQLIPRPGILKYVRYQFDYLDLIASVVSTLVAYYIAKRLYSTISQ